MAHVRGAYVRNRRGKLTQEAFGNLLVPPINQGQIAAWERSRLASIEIDSLRRLAELWHLTLTEVIAESQGSLDPKDVNRILELGYSRVRAIRRIDPRSAASADRRLYREALDTLSEIEATKRDGDTLAAITAYDDLIALLEPRILPGISKADIELMLLLFDSYAEVLSLRSRAYTPADKSIFGKYLKAMHAITEDIRLERKDDGDDEGTKLIEMGDLMRARWHIASAQYSYTQGSYGRALSSIEQAEGSEPDAHVRLEAAALKAMVGSAMPAKERKGEDARWKVIMDARGDIQDLLGKTGDYVAEASAAAQVALRCAVIDKHDRKMYAGELEHLLTGMDILEADHVPARQLIEHNLQTIRTMIAKDD